MPKKVKWICDECQRQAETYKQMPTGWLQLIQKADTTVYIYVFCSRTCLLNWLDSEGNRDDSYAKDKYKEKEVIAYE